MRLFGTPDDEARPAASATDPGEASLTPSIRIAGAWGWRILVVLAVLGVGVWLIAKLSDIVVPFLIALLISALLKPGVTWLVRHRWPKWIAIIVMLLLAIVVLGGLVLLVVWQVRSGLPTLQKESLKSFDNIKGILAAPPFNLTSADYTSFINKGLAALESSSKSLASGVVSVGSTAGHLVADALVTIFATIFLMIDGEGVWRWTTRLFPKKARPAVDGAGQAGWITLATFVRVQIFVAAVDGLGVGLVAYFTGVPLAVPIAVLVFLASFIPVIGAIVSGVFAVVIALLFVGFWPAVILLAGVLGVHLLEAHVLQPLVMGSAVKVHPLAVVFAVAGGSYLAGVPGALFAVPTIAVVNVMVTYVAHGKWREPGSKKEGEQEAAEQVVPDTGHQPA
ncbi:AI-2E family transporter [Frondihabitans cladoniiphilus]|uniref:AI-2E family transporter n=1 Tax=Frondihabitans cladoniiphilus TaxID=715785 RepID=A0ABP8WB33_9MICO